MNKGSKEGSVLGSLGNEMKMGDSGLGSVVGALEMSYEPEIDHILGLEVNGVRRKEVRVRTVEIGRFLIEMEVWDRLGLREVRLWVTSGCRSEDRGSDQGR